MTDPVTGPYDLPADAPAAPPDPAAGDPPGAAPRAVPGAAALSPARVAAGLKFAGVGAILLGLLIPHALVFDVIQDREQYQAQAGNEIGRAWGPDQVLAGPWLELPTRTPIARPAAEGGGTVWQPGRVVVSAQRSRADVQLSPERRRRGLFETVVYTAAAEISGRFAPPDPERLRPGTEILWREASLVVGASGLRAVSADSVLSLGGRERPVADAEGERCGLLDLARLPMPLEPPVDGALPAGALDFAGRIEIRGSGAFSLAPLSRRSEAAIAAPWPTPSFNGAGLPIRSEVTPDGFRAEWSEGGLAPAGSIEPCSWAVSEASGVALIEAVPTYRMVNRASKYATMFLALSFLTYALFELVARVRIHPVQYALLGASVVLFPLILLAFGEPLGFAAGYAISTAAVMAQASLFTAAVTRRPRLAALFAAVLGALFGFLYVVLSLESYALLAGTVALFAALSLVMAVTRRVEWGGR